MTKLILVLLLSTPAMAGLYEDINAQYGFSNTTLETPAERDEHYPPITNTTPPTIRSNPNINTYPNYIRVRDPKTGEYKYVDFY